MVIPRRGARCDPDRAGLHHGGGLVGDAVPRVGGGFVLVGGCLLLAGGRSSLLADSNPKLRRLRA